VLVTIWTLSREALPHQMRIGPHAVMNSRLRALRIVVNRRGPAYTLRHESEDALMVPLSQTSVIVDSVRSPVRASGPVAGNEAVVFLHGNPGSSEDWLDLVRATGEFARAIAPDMPGYGKADRPRDFDYTVAGYARHLDGLLRELAVRRVHFVLHDFGGPWGLHWAAEHKDQIASVTLVNTGVLPGYKWHKFARIWRTPVLGEIFQLAATRRAFHALVNADNPRPFPPAFLDRMFDDADWGMKRAVLKLYRATSDPGGDSERIGEALRPLSLPALVVWGDGDVFLPVRYAKVQASYFDAQVHVLEHCGHWPMIDEPKRVRDLVIPFLQKQVVAPASQTWSAP
jgi:pimeloyl-ACP methyl ester carboxylesterase